MGKVLGISNKFLHTFSADRQKPIIPSVKIAEFAQIRNRLFPPGHCRCKLLPLGKIGIGRYFLCGQAGGFLFYGNLFRFSKGRKTCLFVVAVKAFFSWHQNRRLIPLPFQGFQGLAQERLADAFAAAVFVYCKGIQIGNLLVCDLGIYPVYAGNRILFLGKQRPVTGKGSFIEDLHILRAFVKGFLPK